MSDISDDELDEAVTLLAMLGGSSTSRGSSRRSSGGERKSNERERERERKLENDRKIDQLIQELDDMQKLFIEENSYLKSNQPYRDSAINVIRQTRQRYLDKRARIFENAERLGVKKDLKVAAKQLDSTEEFKAVLETLKKIIAQGPNPPAPQAALDGSDVTERALPQASVSGIPLGQLDTPDNREAALQKEAREKIQASVQSYIAYFKEIFSDEKIANLNNKTDADELQANLTLQRRTIYERLDKVVNKLNEGLKRKIKSGRERVILQRVVNEIEDKIKDKKNRKFDFIGGSPKGPPPRGPPPTPFNKLPDYTVPKPLKNLARGYTDVTERNKDQFMVDEQINDLSLILERSITLLKRELSDAKIKKMNMLGKKIRALDELGRTIKEGMENVFTSIDIFVGRLRRTIMPERRDIDERNETVIRYDVDNKRYLSDVHASFWREHERVLKKLQQTIKSRPPPRGPPPRGSRSRKLVDIKLRF